MLDTLPLFMDRNGFLDRSFHTDYGSIVDFFIFAAYLITQSLGVIRTIEAIHALYLHQIYPISM